MSAMFPTPIRANPPADECFVIARAQSLLTKNGRVGPVLPYAEAKRVVERANKPRIRVTVPERVNA